jgi:hypothetical protein
MRWRKVAEAGTLGALSAPRPESPASPGCAPALTAPAPPCPYPCSHHPPWQCQCGAQLVPVVALGSAAAAARPTVPRARRAVLAAGRNDGGRAGRGPRHRGEAGHPGAQRGGRGRGAFVSGPGRTAAAGEGSRPGGGAGGPGRGSARPACLRLRAAALRARPSPAVRPPRGQPQPSPAHLAAWGPRQRATRRRRWSTSAAVLCAAYASSGVPGTATTRWAPYQLGDGGIRNSIGARGASPDHVSGAPATARRGVGAWTAWYDAAGVKAHGGARGVTARSPPRRTSPRAAGAVTAAAPLPGVQLGALQGEATRRGIANQSPFTGRAGRYSKGQRGQTKWSNRGVGRQGEGAGNRNGEGGRGAGAATPEDAGLGGRSRPHFFFAPPLPPSLPPPLPPLPPLPCFCCRSSQYRLPAKPPAASAASSSSGSSSPRLRAREGRGEVAGVGGPREGRGRRARARVGGRRGGARAELLRCGAACHPPLLAAAA